MADIKTIAATYAARIFDRMEMCRGSAILKSDIEREVEAALREYADDFDDDDDIEGLSELESEFCTVISEHTIKGADACFTVTSEHQAGPVFGVSPAMGVLGEARKCLEDYRKLTVDTSGPVKGVCGVDPPICITYASVPDQVKENARARLGTDPSDFLWMWEFIPGNFTDPRDRHRWQAVRGDRVFEDMTLAQDT